MSEEWVGTPFIDWSLDDRWQRLFHGWRFDQDPKSDFHEATIGQEYDQAQLVKYSFKEPSDTEVKLASKYMDAGLPFAERTIFAGPFSDPTDISRPNRFVGFIHLEEIPDDLAWFIEQVRIFDKNQSGNVRIQINPVKPSNSNGNSESKITSNDGGVLLAHRQKKNSVYESTIWASTHIIPGKLPLQPQHQLAWVTACIGRSEMNMTSLAENKAARGCINITLPEPTSDQDLILTGLRYFISQYNSYSNSLVFSHGGVRAVPREVELNMLHALMYDPIAQISLPDESEVQITCAINSLEQISDTPDVWPGDKYSLWHLQRPTFLHTDSSILVSAFWKYIRKPCSSEWIQFEQIFDDYFGNIERISLDLYSQRIRDLDDDGEQRFTLHTLIHKLEELTEDYPDYFSTDDVWNLRRLRNFIELSTLISSTSHEISSSPHPEYQVLLCHIRLFGDLLQKISNQFKFAEGNSDDCIQLFVIGGDEW